MNVTRFLRSLTADDLDVMAKYRPLSSVRIVLTGALDEGLRRDTFVSWLETWGATVETEVRPATDFLLAVDPDRMTVKRREAARFGITVLSETAFVKNVLDKAKKAAHDDALRVLAATGPAVPVPDPTWFTSDDGIPAEEEFEDEIRPLGDYVAPETGKRVSS